MAAHRKQHLPQPDPAQVNPLALREPEYVEGQAPIIRPWERLPREPDQAWALFIAYRDMGYPNGAAGEFHGRSNKRLATALGLSEGYISSLSSTYKWADRAGAYDRALDAARVEKDLDSVRIMRGTHLRILKKAKTLVEKELDKYIRKSEADPEMNVMSLRDLSKMLEQIVRLERLIHGEPESRTEVEGSWDLDRLDLEQLEQLAKIADQASGK